MPYSQPTTEPIPAPSKPALMTVTVAITAIVQPESVGGFSASVPALPGCVTEGDTLEDIQANLREAAEGWLGAMHDRETRRAARGRAEPSPF